MKQPLSQIARKIHGLVQDQETSSLQLLYSQTSFSEFGKSFAYIQQILPSLVVLWCDVHDHSVRYISKNCQQVFGYPYDQMQAMTLDDFFSHIHVGDQQGMSRIMQYMFQQTKSISVEEHLHYRFISNYRFRHANGQYFNLQDEKIALENKDGQILYLTLFKDISHEKAFAQVKLEIYKLEHGAFRKIEDYLPILPHHGITRREREVLQLIQCGQSNKEIAMRLFISENTARNHRSHLFEKTNAKNVVELLNHARAMQWI